MKHIKQIGGVGNWQFFKRNLTLGVLRPVLFIPYFNHLCKVNKIDDMYGILKRKTNFWLCVCDIIDDSNNISLPIHDVNYIMSKSLRQSLSCN